MEDLHSHLLWRILEALNLKPASPRPYRKESLGPKLGLGFRVQGVRFRLPGLGFRIQGLGLRFLGVKSPKPKAVEPNED